MYSPELIIFDHCFAQHSLIDNIDLTITKQFVVFEENSAEEWFLRFMYIIIIVWARTEQNFIAENFETTWFGTRSKFFAYLKFLEKKNYKILPINYVKIKLYSFGQNALERCVMCKKV